MSFTSEGFRPSVLVWNAHCRALRIASAGRSLEPERPGLVRAAGDRVEVAVQQHPVDHRVTDAGRVVDVVERVLVEDHQVGELARLDRAEVVIEAVRARRVDRRGAQRLQVAHSAEREAPDLPVRAQALALAVGTDRDRNAEIADLLGLAGNVDDVVLIVRDHGWAARPGIEQCLRRPFGLDRLGPGGVVLVPVIFAERPAVGDD